MLLFLWLTDPLQFAFISFAPFLSGWCFRALTWCFLTTALLFLATCPVPARSELTSYGRLRGLCKLWGQEDSPCPLFFPRTPPSDITEMQILKMIMKIKCDLEKTLTPHSKVLISPLFSACCFGCWWFNLGRWERYSACCFHSQLHGQIFLLASEVSKKAVAAPSWSSAPSLFWKLKLLKLCSNLRSPVCSLRCFYL